MAGTRAVVVPLGMEMGERNAVSLLEAHRVPTFPCGWNWSGSLDGLIVVQPWNGNERGGRSKQQLLHQTDMRALKF